MKNKETRAQRISAALDLPLDVLCDIARIEIMGKSDGGIENIRGILDYNENCVKVNTTVGILKIDGEDLFIESITDEGIIIKGLIKGVEFL